MILCLFKLKVSQNRAFFLFEKIEILHNAFFSTKLKTFNSLQNVPIPKPYNTDILKQSTNMKQIIHLCASAQKDSPDILIIVIERGFPVLQCSVLSFWVEVLHLARWTSTKIPGLVERCYICFRL